MPQKAKPLADTRIVPRLLIRLAVIAKSTKNRLKVITIDTAGRPKLKSVTGTNGERYAPLSLPLILYVKCASVRGNTQQRLRYITSNHLQTAAPMILKI